MKIANLAEAKLIVSQRDPLDSLVSQMERFSQSPRLSAIDLSRSYATIATLDDQTDRLTYRYEDRVTDNTSTIKEVARFLGLTTAPDQVDEIFRSLAPSEVRAFITARQNTFAADVAPTQDPVTQWHPGHVGDGQIGKWRERLSVATQRMSTGSLAPLARSDLWQTQTLRWSSELFHYGSPQEDAPTVELTCDGSARCLVYGPYMHLPRGRWRATPLVEAASRWRSVRWGADVYLPNSGYEPVEIRLASVSGERGSVRFSGCELNWLGPCN